MAKTQQVYNVHSSISISILSYQHNSKNPNILKCLRQIVLLCLINWCLSRMVSQQTLFSVDLCLSKLVSQNLSRLVTN